MRWITMAMLRTIGPHRTLFPDPVPVDCGSSIWVNLLGVRGAARNAYGLWRLRTRAACIRAPVAFIRNRAISVLTWCSSATCSSVLCALAASSRSGRGSSRAPARQAATPRLARLR
jgi:hypothetical protein